VLVVGIGAQGLLMMLALQARGVSVRVHDPNAERVALALRLGAQPVAAEGPESPFELVVDTVGSPASMNAAIGRLQVGGTLLVLGLDGRPLELTAQTIVRRQLVVRGSLTYDHPHDFEAAVGLVAQGRFSPREIVTEEHPIEDAQRAFDQGASAPGKTWIRVATAR
jgi:alcohol dehydrogenase/L-iditol 2-dehydrogenase